MTELGAAMERSATDEDYRQLQSQLETLSRFLDRPEQHFQIPEEWIALAAE